MSREVVKAEWITGQFFWLYDRGGFSILMNQPKGVNASDLLPLSVIGCSAWDIISILQKQKQPVERFEVTAESQREEQAPWCYLSILITYHFWGAGLDRGKIQRAIDLTEEKYCSTFATIRKVVRLESAVEIEQT
jgi:putative redox protein